jgi:putative hydrolase of the HAD superfamily
MSDGGSAAREARIDTLLLDIGGVLATNGWDTAARDRAAARFGLERDEMEARHRLAFDAYEVGAITLRQYLELSVFWRTRDFAPEDFESFMFEQSSPHEEAIAFFRELKERSHVRVVAVSNEGRELADYRNRSMSLTSWIDGFVVSGHVGMRKPHPGIYRLALAVASTTAEQALVIDDRPLFVEMAAILGLRALHFSDVETARREVAELGLG